VSRTRREFLRSGGAAAAALAATGPAGAVAAAATRPSGFRLGFSSLRDETRIAGLPIEGRMPRWLTGTLLRNGPALFEVGPDRFNHWFDGLAMLHAFSFERGRVDYANRFLRSSAYKAWKQDGRIRFSEFATDPCRRIFSGVSTLPVLGRVPNGNVSIERLGRRFRALTEIPVPVRFDAHSLRTLGVEAALHPGRLGTAHPHHDPATGERFSYEIELIPPSGLRILTERRGRRRELAWIPDAAPGYLHSFALTPRYVAVLTQPFNFDLARFLSPDRGPIVTNYGWHADQPSRIHLVDRGGGGVVSATELEPFFVFHHVNAFEHKGRVMLDVCAHRDSTIVDALYLKRLRRGGQVPRAALRRIEVDPTRSRAKQRDLIEQAVELPRTDYERVNGRPYRYAYGVGLRRADSAFIDQLVKADVRRGEGTVWRERGMYPGEPVFVPRPGRRREDDGVLLSVVLDAGRRSSALVVLDARSMQEVARAAVPHHIPFGFHGVYGA
jgi:carotenoid cleavage dioxygenase-like enzyme